jgi:hypothetical protein
MEGIQALVDDYFYIDYDESAQRALNHTHEACGSNTTILGLAYIRVQLIRGSFRSDLPRLLSRRMSNRIFIARSLSNSDCFV